MKVPQILAAAIVAKRIKDQKDKKPTPRVPLGAWEWVVIAVCFGLMAAAAYWIFAK